MINAGHGSQAENFFDQLTSEELKPAKPQQNQQVAAKGDGSSAKPAASAPLQSPTAPVVCNIFSAEKTAPQGDNQPTSSSQDPFDNITIGKTMLNLYKLLCHICSLLILHIM